MATDRKGLEESLRNLIPTIRAAGIKLEVDVNEGDLVRKEWGCPNCGERRQDYLVWNDDELVECASCHTIYDPEDWRSRAAAKEA